MNGCFVQNTKSIQVSEVKIEQSKSKLSGQELKIYQSLNQF